MPLSSSQHNPLPSIPWVLLFSIKWRCMTSTMGRFNNVGLVRRMKRIVMSQGPCGGALKGSREISSTQPWPRKCSKMEIPVGGVIMPHAAHSWSLLWAAPWADKSLSTWGPRVVCTLGCQSPREKVPFCGTPGVGETPCRALRRARLQLFFELCRGMVCLLAARMSTLWWGSGPFVCGQKEAVIQPERGDLSRSSLFKPTLLTHNVIHHLDLTPWMQMRFKRTLLCIRQLSHTTQWLGDAGPSLSISAPYPTALSFGGSGETISKVMMLIRTKCPVALQPQVFGTLQRMSQERGMREKRSEPRRVEQRRWDKMRGACRCSSPQVGLWALHSQLHSNQWGPAKTPLQPLYSNNELMSFCACLLYVCVCVTA